MNCLRHEVHCTSNKVNTSLGVLYSTPGVKTDGRRGEEDWAHGGEWKVWGGVPIFPTAPSQSRWGGLAGGVETPTHQGFVGTPRGVSTRGAVGRLAGRRGGVKRSSLPPDTFPLPVLQDGQLWQHKVGVNTSTCAVLLLNTSSN